MHKRDWLLLNMVKKGDVEQLLCNGIDTEHNYACISRSELSSRVERYRVFHSNYSLRST